MSEGRSVADTVSEADWCAYSIPVAGDTASHEPPTSVAVVAFHVRVPPPVLVIVIVCLSGLDWPTTALKAIAVGDVSMIGVAGCAMVSVTGKVCVPAVELKTTAPVYVLGARPATLTLTDGLAGVVPFALPCPSTFSQCPSLSVVVVALQFNDAEHPCDTLKSTLLAIDAGCD